MLTKDPDRQVRERLESTQTLLLLQLGVQGAAVDAQCAQESVESARSLDTVHED